MLNGPFAENMTAELVQPINGVDTVVGYMFANPADSGETTQEQRWVLYPGFAAPNKRRTTLRMPPKLLLFTSLSDWQAAVKAGEGGRLWKRGATYVKVNTVSYSSIAGQAAPQVPSLVAASGTTVGRMQDRVDQIDDGPANLHQNDISVGWLYGSPIAGVASSATRSNVERWVLSSDYKVPFVALPLTGLAIQPANFTVTSSEAFMAFAEDAWTEGSTYSISSCTYLAGLPANP